MRPQLALSVRQPWAWAIVVLGKDIENRDWRTRYRGRVLIHAGKGLRGDDVEGFLATIKGDQVLTARLKAAGGLNAAELRRQCGGIVGEVDITGCVTASPSPWFAGKFGFVLANPKPLPFRPCPGQLGFFDPDRAARSAPEPPTPPLDLFTSRHLEV